MRLLILTKSLVFRDDATGLWFYWKLRLVELRMEGRRGGNFKKIVGFLGKSWFGKH